MGRQHQVHEHNIYHVTIEVKRTVIFKRTLCYFQFFSSYARTSNKNTIIVKHRVTSTVRSVKCIRCVVVYTILGDVLNANEYFISTPLRIGRNTITFGSVTGYMLRGTLNLQFDL